MNVKDLAPIEMKRNKLKKKKNVLREIFMKKYFTRHLSFLFVFFQV